MAALFFPNLNALRLALTSGLVPSEITRNPAAAGFDTHGRLWLEPAELPSRESLAALARLGVQALGGTAVPTRPVSCWAELVPLHRSSDIPTGLGLFLSPERQLAQFVARLRRSGHAPVSVMLPDVEPKASLPGNLPTPATGPQGHGWVTVLNPPPALLAETLETGSQFEAFAQLAPGVWVRHGWRHAVPEQLRIPQGCILLLRPPSSVVAVPGEVHHPALDEFRLPPYRSPQRSNPPPAPSISIRLTLSVNPSPAPESLWVLDAAGETEFWAFCAAADERLTRRLEVAPVGSGANTRLVVRAVEKKASPFLPLPTSGYAPDPRIPGLFIPAEKLLRPVLRVRELARALGVASGLVVWVESDAESGVKPHSVSQAAFRPVSELIEYTPPAAVALPVAPRSDPFPLARFVLQPEPSPLLEPAVEGPQSEDEDVLDLSDEHLAEQPGWVVRALRRLLGHFLPTRAEEPEPAPPPPPAQPEKRRPRPAQPARRVERNLASPDALLHGHDWAARRRELEGRLFRDLPRLGPAGRAERWADLASVYSATGNAGDAAVCWMNAVWESPNPPTEWLEDWLAAECREAKLTDTAGGLDRWLSEPGRPGVGRVVAAYTALTGSLANPPAEFIAALPRLLAFLDQHFDDLPVRAAWLARLAAARVCDGDALGLARWRDRVLTRLADRGPGLDLDEPSFLRFHGTASAERFQTAREWLKRVRKQALEWVQEQRGGPLRFAGLDAETECTRAYAEFMFAWGLGCLGERTLAKAWAGKARKLVASATGPRVDPAVHAVVGDLFLLRVKDAQEGRAAKPGLPAELQARLDALPELARYAVHRLRRRSRILEPLDRVQAFLRLDLKAFLGHDPLLGDRLFILLGSSDRDQIAREADTLLQLCAAAPTTANVPRVVLTLLEVAPRLAPPALLRVLDLLPTAIDWTEAWIAGRWPDAERRKMVRKYQTWMIEAGFATAGALPPAIVNPTIRSLLRRFLAAGESIRPALFEVCASVFRALRRLGLRSEAETLVRFLDTASETDLEAGKFAVARLGLAAGWYTAGDDEAGYRIVNEASEALYLAGNLTVDARTKLAIAYAEALGFAPPRIAHGRLAELFQHQRLGQVKVDGATNTYFTLQPLQLIDAVVRSVVTDDFTLGPAVRGWLDDDEFLIRGRIHRDLATVLREQGIG